MSAASHAHEEPRYGGALPASGGRHLRAVPAVRTLREVLRVSFDESGRERSHDEQHGDHVRGVEDARGALTLSDLPPYRSTGSVSRYARKLKRSFIAIMADLESGAFGADGLLMWESSRVTRDAGEWIDLLRLMERTGKVLCIWNHGMRVYDPANHHDWHSMMRDAIDAERESRITSERVRRAMAANADEGRPNGGRRAYGFTPDGMDTVPEEVEHIKEAVARVLRGDSPRAIARSFNERGILSASGKAWHPGPLANMLRGTRIAGIRTHHGEVMRPQPGKPWTPAPAIVTMGEHRRLVATLAARSRTGDRGRVAWELTGLLRCGWCGAVLVGNTDAAGVKGGALRRRYVCRKAPGYNGCGRLGIKAEPVEQLLGDIVVARLGDLTARRAAVPEEDDAEERRELEAIAGARVAVAEQYAVDLDAESKNEAMGALRRRAEVVEARLAAKVRDVSPLAFVMAEGLEGATWEDTPIGKRRVILRALIDHVVVAPATTRGSTRFEASRITKGIVWRA